MIRQVKKWSGTNIDRLYTISFVFMYISALIYGSYAYYTSPMKDTDIRIMLQRSPLLSVVLIIGSLNVFAGWYLWKKRSYFYQNTKDAVVWMLVLMICQLALGNVAGVVAMLFTLMGITTNAHVNRSNDQKVSWKIIIYAVLITIMYLFSIYLVYLVVSMK